MGKASFWWTADVLVPAAANAWVAFDMGENYGGSAEVPDFSLHLQLGFRFPPSRRWVGLPAFHLHGKESRQVCEPPRP